MDNEQFDSEWYQHESQRKQECLESVGELARTLYSERGEDNRTAAICNQMTDLLEREGA